MQYRIQSNSSVVLLALTRRRSNNLTEKMCLQTELMFSTQKTTEILGNSVKPLINDVQCFFVQMSFLCTVSQGNYGMVKVRERLWL